MNRAPIFLLMTMFLASGAGCARKERVLPPQERPFYGGVLSPQELASESKRNDALIRQTGSKDAAVQKTLEEALATYQRGYFELAMHRYNQAWLMDPKNPEVTNGFALVLGAQNKFNEALAIHQKYLESNPDHAMTLCRMARLTQDKAVDLLAGDRLTGAQVAEAGALLEEALKLYDRSAQKAKLNCDLSFIYYQWAIALAIKKDTAGAWDKVHLSRQYGGEFIEKKFLETLTKDGPEPAPAASQ